MRAIILLSAFILLFYSSGAQKTYRPDWESIDSRPIPGWYEDAKFEL